MEIEYASQLDFQFILENDRHVSKDLIKNKLIEKEIIIVKNQENQMNRPSIFTEKYVSSYRFSLIIKGNSQRDKIFENYPLSYFFKKFSPIYIH